MNRFSLPLKILSIIVRTAHLWRATSGMNRCSLPPEILSIIVQHVYSERTLLNISQCSRFLQIEAERALYREVAYVPKFGIGNIRCLSACPRLAGYIHSLDLSMVCQYPIASSEIKVLESLRNSFHYMDQLKILALSAVVNSNRCLIPSTKCPFRLNSLSIADDCPNGELRDDVLAFLQVQTDIEDLDIYFESLDRVSSSLFFPRLKTLHSDGYGIAPLLLGRSVKRLFFQEDPGSRFPGSRFEGAQSLQVLRLEVFSNLQRFVLCFSNLRYLELRLTHVSALIYRLLNRRLISDPTHSRKNQRTT